MRIFGPCCLVLLCSLMSNTREASAQMYRDKIVQVMVGFSSGGNSDRVARPVAQKLSDKTGGTFLINNRSGGTGIIANEIVAKARPDGYTLLIAPSSSVTSVPHLHSRMPYDSLSDLVPIIKLGGSPNIVISHPGVPAKTVQDIIQIAKRKPDVLNFGSSGVGAGNHLAGELFKHMAKVEILHVPYSDITLALTDLLGGRIDLMFPTYAIVRPFVGTGKLRVIAVTSLTRYSPLPTVPTVDESGLRGYEVSTWVGLFAPKATSVNIVNYLNTTIQDVLSTPEMQMMWKNQGIEFKRNTPGEFASFVRDSYRQYGKIIQTTGIKPE